MMDLVFMRLALEKFRCSKNPFHWIWFRLKMLWFKYEIVTGALETYDFYELVRDYIDVIFNITHSGLIKEGWVTSEDRSDCIDREIIVFKGGLSGKLRMANEDCEIELIPITYCGNTNVSLVFSLYYEGTKKVKEIYRFDINDNTDYNKATNIGRLKSYAVLSVRILVLESIHDILNGREFK